MKHGDIPPKVIFSTVFLLVAFILSLFLAGEPKDKPKTFTPTQGTWKQEVENYNALKESIMLGVIKI